MPYLTREETGDESISCKVMTAALDLFVENGYHNVSIHDVQKRAGVSMGSVYNHFGGKEGVAKSLYDHLVLEMELVLDQVEAEVESPAGQCREVIVRLMGFSETHRNIMAYIFNARHSEIVEGASSICSSTPFQRMREMVVRAMDSGEFRRMHPMVAASMVFGGAIRMVQLRLDGLIDEPLPCLQAELLEAVWNAVAVDQSLDQSTLGAVANG